MPDAATLFNLAQHLRRSLVRSRGATAATLQQLLADGRVTDAELDEFMSLCAHAGDPVRGELVRSLRALSVEQRAAVLGFYAGQHVAPLTPGG